ncbi:MAG: hypothetical protein ACOH5I_07710 [Oligoflexus sp.]
MTHWLKITDYAFERPYLIVLVSPHGSHGRKFFQEFSSLRRERVIFERSELWEDYLRIEQDYGATELAHLIAEMLNKETQKLGCRVIEFDYPRGLIDGGRILEHCLRPCLPQELFATYRQSFLEIHRDSLVRIGNFYRELQQRPHLLIDIHTMASYCPHNDQGKAQTIPVSWEAMDDYVQQFVRAKQMAPGPRKIDLISAARNGDIIADDRLRTTFIHQMQRRSYPFAENHPYFAADEFLMHQHMNNARGIAIDIPKHLLAEQEDDLFHLPCFDLSPKKMTSMAEMVCDALLQHWASP